MFPAKNAIHSRGPRECPRVILYYTPTMFMLAPRSTWRRTKQSAWRMCWLSCWRQPTIWVSQHQSDSMKQHLLTKIQNRTATVAVIGLGYVGLPLAVAFVEQGFPVTFAAAQCRPPSAQLRTCFDCAQDRPCDCAQDRPWHRSGRPQGGRAEPQRVVWAGYSVGAADCAAYRSVQGDDEL